MQQKKEPTLTKTFPMKLPLPNTPTELKVLDKEFNSNILNYNVGDTLKL